MTLFSLALREHSFKDGRLVDQLLYAYVAPHS